MYVLFTTHTPTFCSISPLLQHPGGGELQREHDLLRGGLGAPHPQRGHHRRHPRGARGGGHRDQRRKGQLGDLGAPREARQGRGTWRV